ncbi:hypothetical protein [Andreprevotia chitinilytica]|uniref:hypothetical protein n=1 Tax=Andreprevotia chitinilytica TaxID=396808 RepID=UPI00055416B8|nr:hypothetical protein [Andreprevotia chitinilytica]
MPRWREWRRGRRGDNVGKFNPGWILEPTPAGKPSGLRFVWVMDSRTKGHCATYILMSFSAHELLGIMPLFRCSILGENFPGTLAGVPEPIGFYATRYVKASSADEAEAAALKLLRQDKDLALPQGTRMQDARIYFEEIIEVASNTEQVSNSGFSFFRMGT